MTKKAAFLVFFVSVAALVCANKTNGADLNLVGWWKFDGDVLDGSGNGRNGSLQGDAHFEPGLFDQALALDGTGDYATINGYKGILGGNPFSISAWVKSTSSGDVTMVNWGTQTGGQRVDFRLYQGKLRVEHGNGNLQGNTTVADGEWHHVALTVTANAPISYPQVIFYLDGKDDSQTTTDPDTFNIVANVDVTIGRRGTNNDRAFPGLIDDVRIYDRVLTAAEIKDLARRPRSYGPDPADGTFLGTPFAVLSWKPGGYAVQHDMYFGTNPMPGPAEYVGRQTTAFYYAPGLQIAATYYWRIDDVEGDGATIHQGDVWSFTVLSKTASRPNPYHGAKYVDPNATLNWTAGLGAVFHNVYFGVNFEDVNAGVGGTSKGRQLAISYSPGPLASDTVYYWRIDEVQMDMTTVHKGEVWSFRTMPLIPIADPNLVGWWTFDEGQGSTAVDWSGHNNHGTLTGNPQWIAGYAGGALDFDGSGDRVEMTYRGVTGTRSRTVTAWIKTATSGEIISWGDNVAGQKWIFRTQHVAAGFISGAIRVEVNGGYAVGYGDLRDSEWHHVAAVLVDDGSPDALEITLYVDGSLEPTSTEQDEPINTAANGNVRIGESPWHNRPFTGQIDDVRIYDKALTQSDIKQVMRVDPLVAWDPSPRLAAIVDIDQAKILSWAAGDKATQHDVYLGTDRTSVDNANTSDTTGVYRGRQNTTSYTPPEALKWGQTYYWRIDEYNTDGTISKGRTWTFTVADYLIADDFESYTDDVGSRIFQTWKDGFGYTEPAPGYSGNGTGSAVGYSQAPFAERTIVHSGSQSMPLAYDNSGTGGKARYCETQREWASPKDWTRNGVKALTLYVRGNPPDFLESPAGTFTMSAEGTDVWGASDEFRYVYKQLSGDGEIIARVVQIGGPGTNEWRKAGVMIRESLDPASNHAFMAVTPLASHGLAFQFRHEVGDSDSEHGVDVQTAPYWVKVVRKGNVFTGYHSPDGINWTMKDPSGVETDAMNPVTITMGANVYIGLALTSHENDVLCMAQFSNVSTSGSVAGAWTVVDIASTVTGSNAAEALYVALEDSTGKTKVVKNNDPLATVQADWQEWNIDLAQFSGVNLASVKKMYIGVGDRNLPVAGGTGMLYIDDIRLYRPRCVPSVAKPSNDLSGNCVVDYADLEIMADAWLDTGPAVVADLDGDDDVDLKDYAILVDTWLEELLWP